jgi:hypothetical protein
VIAGWELVVSNAGLAGSCSRNQADPVRQSARAAISKS